MRKPANQFFTFFLPIPILVFFTLSLTGCVSSSPGIPNIFLASLRTSNVPEIRVGYFGICVSRNESANCISTPSGTTSNTVIKSLSLPDSAESVVETAFTLQSSLFPCINAAAALLFIIGLIWHAFKSLGKNRQSQNRNLSKAGNQNNALARISPKYQFILSAILSLAAAIATAHTANALEWATEGISSQGVVIHGGKTLQILQWLAFCFLVLFSAVLSLGDGRNTEGGGGVDRPQNMSRPFMPPPPPMTP